LTVEIANLAERYNRMALRIQSILSYVDINVAGFRKVLKQFDKQVPHSFRESIAKSVRYTTIAWGMSDLAKNVASIRFQIESIMQALSPGAPRLLDVNLGSETSLALDGTDQKLYPECERDEIGSGSTGSPEILCSESRLFDFIGLRLVEDSNKSRAYSGVSRAGMD